MWPFFSSLPALLLCVPPVCWCASGISLSLSLFSLPPSLCHALWQHFTPTPPSTPPTLLYSFSLSHWPRAPRGDGTSGSFDTGMQVKALQHVRVPCELVLPYWHTFYANELPGLGDKRVKRGRDGERGEEVSLGHRLQTSGWDSNLFSPRLPHTQGFGSGIWWCSVENEDVTV